MYEQRLNPTDRARPEQTAANQRVRLSSAQRCGFCRKEPSHIASDREGVPASWQLPATTGPRGGRKSLDIWRAIARVD